MTKMTIKPAATTHSAASAQRNESGKL
ncbi:protein of unknown function [Micropruina glycogenica]|uniref:Uncharacterized protein n=1 Tax=Micropruina glycogenica TaxID=75385 RepID=A0A2N9JIX6_9ACTN|nr:protein of unknown function [Micropruina glycogenica]